MNRREFHFSSLCLLAKQANVLRSLMKEIVIFQVLDKFVAGVSESIGLLLQTLRHTDDIH